MLGITQDDDVVCLFAFKLHSTNFFTKALLIIAFKTLTYRDPFGTVKSQFYLHNYSTHYFLMRRRCQEWSHILQVCHDINFYISGMLILSKIILKCFRVALSLCGTLIGTSQMGTAVPKWVSIRYQKYFRPVTDTSWLIFMRSRSENICKSLLRAKSPDPSSYVSVDGYYTTGQKKRDTFYFSIENPIKPTLREQL